jgi:hypothetical protein
MGELAIISRQHVEPAEVGTQGELDADGRRSERAGRGIEHLARQVGRGGDPDRIPG